MADAKTNSELNRILIRLYRSKLQYIGECWPWTSAAEAGEEREIRGLVDLQRVQVERLVELLTAREWSIDFGFYPDLSELHYVNLDYALETLVHDAEETIHQLQLAWGVCAADAEAATRLAAILGSERASLARLKSLATARLKMPAMSS